MSPPKSLQEQLEHILLNSQRHTIDLAQLPALKSNPQLTAIRSVRSVLAVVFAISALYLIPKYCRSYSDCHINIPTEFAGAFLPAQECGFCEGITEVDVVQNLSPHEFEKKYAYSGRPVVITDATTNWTALNTFDYWYFKNIYESAQRNKRRIDCQFLPFKSNLANLTEALKMPKERVNYAPGTDPWYFGWGNDNPMVAEQLRQQYGRPYFLPETSESDDVDWMFMGGVGMGAHLHVDHVPLDSWQAQIKGTKEWTIAPPAECYFRCSAMSVTVQTGEIIVIKTDAWYHKTRVLPGEISITIGAEYD